MQCPLIYYNSSSRAVIGLNVLWYSVDNSPPGYRGYPTETLYTSCPFCLPSHCLPSTTTTFADVPPRTVVMDHPGKMPGYIIACTPQSSSPQIGFDGMMAGWLLGSDQCWAATVLYFLQCNIWLTTKLPVSQAPLHCGKHNMVASSFHKSGQSYQIDLSNAAFK